MFMSNLHRARSVISTGIAVVAHVDGSSGFEVLMSIGKSSLIEQHHASHRSIPVAYGLGSFYHLYHVGSSVIYFWRMIFAPALTLQAYAVVQQKNAAAVHALNDRFGNGIPSAYGAYARHGFQQFCQRGRAYLFERVLPDGGCLLQYRGLFTLGNDRNFRDLFYVLV